MFLTDKSPLPHPNLISPAFPSVFLRLLVSENSAAVKEKKLLLKTFTPSVFRPRAFFFTRTQYFFLTVVCSLSPRPLSLSLDCFRLFRFFSSRRKTVGFRKTFLKSHIVDETVLDPFAGSGTTSLAAMKLGRNSIGYENRCQSYADTGITSKGSFRIEHDTQRETPDGYSFE